MAHPCLGFCPYLAANRIIEFADWELGPLNAFDARWTDPNFERQSKAFLAKFVDNGGRQIENPSLLCRRGAQIDGQRPLPEEIEALEAAIAFAFLDQNPRNTPHTRHHSWEVVTADNAEPFFWPVDVDAGYVTVTSGLMVRTMGGGYRISDPELVIKPPLDLHMPLGPQSADAMCLEAVYRTALSSLQQPGTNPVADRLRTAIGWFAKAWRNTATVHFPERVVFLKTAFEALTGTSKSHLSARALRLLFEALPRTSPTDSELLVWSPAERPVHARVFVKNVKQQTEQVTDLEQWFMAFADARNTIIHQGIVPPLEYSGSNTAYDGHFVFTAEYLLRAVVKVSLAQFGYPDLWRSAIWRAVKAADEELERRAGDPALGDGSGVG
jgi:hypothetical protein